jgi:hypothetical protein
MAMIHVNRGATSLGAFPEEQVREGLRTGRFAPSDLGWREGMATWQPLSQFAEFAGDMTVGAASAPLPQTGPAATPQMVAVTNVEGTGLPWENRAGRGMAGAFIETVQMVLTKPDAAFRSMRPEGGLADPIIYVLIGGCLGGAVAFLYSFGFQSIGMMGERHNALGYMVGMGAGSAFLIVLLPLMILIGLFIGSAIVHLCLMIVGGANKSFETTLRVLAFSQGSTGLLQIVPVCGGLIAFIWGLVTNCIGLARAHQTDTGRAVLAVFLPLIVCCGGIITVALMLGGLTAMQHAGQ